MPEKLPIELTPLEEAKAKIAAMISKELKLDSKVRIPISKASGGKNVSVADLALPCFPLLRFFKGKKPNEVAEIIVKAIENVESDVVAKAEVSGPYVNFILSTKYLGTIVEDVNNGALMKGMDKTKEKVMIEYSQPNTHKVFHVGHMRNAALGDCLVRLYEFYGHPVVAANYFGDEGAHIAKCLWKLKRHVKEHKFDIDTIPEEKRAEWLGSMYSGAVAELTLKTYTKMPFMNVIAGKVTEIKDHPDEKAPKNWHVVKLEVKPSEFKTVICGGRGYNVGDFVAYLPVGNFLKGKKVVEKDMQGVVSSGVMLGYTEVDVPEPADPKPPKSAKPEEKKTEVKNEDGGKKGKKGKGKKKGGGGGKKGKKAKKVKLPAKIYIVDPKYEPKPGDSLPELGRKPEAKGIDNIQETIKKRNTEVGDMLRLMEEGDKEAVELWTKTKKWSLDEFKRVYAWLNCRFDHDFFESEVSETSRKLVIELEKKGVLTKENGAIVADLRKNKLGYLILLKSNGAGLYATKDLQLAQIKFDTFKVDKSIYVVDASQELHFKQVFKVLKLMGYKQAEKCVHLPYGMVVLPSGKMSSRKGTVIAFNALKEMLSEHLQKEYLNKYKGVWPEKQIQDAEQQLAVGTIKYGMLAHDIAKDIVFEMGKWSAKTGTTGPYSMYAYARICGIKTKVEAGEAKCELGKADYGKYITSQLEKDILMHIANFWNILRDCLSRNNPSPLCAYVFNLAKFFNIWYENTSVVGSANGDELATRLAFSQCIGKTIKTCLELLGITPLEKM